jgi:hypothetical protein
VTVVTVNGQTEQLRIQSLAVPDSAVAAKLKERLRGGFYYIFVKIHSGCLRNKNRQGDFYVPPNNGRERSFTEESCCGKSGSGTTTVLQLYFANSSQDSGVYQIGEV